MTGAERYVLLGLAPSRAEWFAAVASWATSAAIPAEFVKCVSPEQVAARLASGRVYSAAVVDAEVPGLDRDLLDRAVRAGCPVVVVGGAAAGAGARDWPALGAAAVLAPSFGPSELLAVLAAVARPVAAADGSDPTLISPVAGLGMVPDGGPMAALWGRSAAVCGPGGTGTSTVAIALAQGLATSDHAPRGVLLADLARHAQQALLHDAGDVVPGVQELAEAHRARRLTAADVRAFAFAVEERRYDLVLGLRRASAWAGLRPRAVEAALDTLRGAYEYVVCDTDADLEGEAECGSADVEERNVLARAAVGRADVVFVVGVPGVKGTHSLLRVVEDVCAFGVPPAAVVPVVNRAPRGPRARGEVEAALGRLAPPGLRPPVFLPERAVDDRLRDGLRLPPQLTQPLVEAFFDLAYRTGGRHAALGGEGGGEGAVAAVPVAPGSLGSWLGRESSGPESSGPGSPGPARGDGAGA